MSSLDLRRGNSQKNQHLGLQELEQRDRFIHRHIGPSEQDIAEMLQTLGMLSLEELIDKVVPDSIRMSGELELPEMCAVLAGFHEPLASNIFPCL